MKSDRDSDRIRDLLAEQAASWYLDNRQPGSDAERARFLLLLKSSPLHVQEYLGTHRIAHELAAIAPEASTIDRLVERAISEEDSRVLPIDAQPQPAVHPMTAGRARRYAAAALVVLAVGVPFLLWRNHSPAPPVPSTAPTVLTIRSGHGEQRTQALADASVLHLNTDTEVVVSLSSGERAITLRRGEASFEVAHEARPFKVLAGAAEITARGTIFAVRLEQSTTVVTVVAGRIAIAPSPGSKQLLTDDAAGTRNPRLPVVELAANEQIRVSPINWPTEPSAVDANRVTAWLRNRIVFEREPLANVAAELNRYASTPIEIDTPELRGLPISGVFACDDTDAFVRFLRRLKDVHVDVTATRIRVTAAHTRPSTQPSVDAAH